MKLTATGFLFVVFMALLLWMDAPAYMGWIAVAVGLTMWLLSRGEK